MTGTAAAAGRAPLSSCARYGMTTRERATTMTSDTDFAPTHLQDKRVSKDDQRIWREIDNCYGACFVEGNLMVLDRE